jgi:L-threonylcarbamoyladenylate synthase
MKEIIKREVSKAIEVMRDGGVILYPTDTIWGIGCDATNEAAVRRVYEIKHRVDSKALITLVDSDARLQRYVRNVPNVAWDLLELATRPLTLILDGACGLAPNLLAEDGSVGLRITHEEFSHELCFRFQKAIVSTSANISGEPSPANFSEVSEEIRSAVDYVVDYRQNERAKSVASSIIKLTPKGEVTVIRK